MKYKLLKAFWHIHVDARDCELPIGTIIELSEKDAKAGVEQGMFALAEKEKGIKPSDWIIERAQKCADEISLEDVNSAFDWAAGNTIQSILDFLDLLAESGQIHVLNNQKDL